VSGAAAGDAGYALLRSHPADYFLAVTFQAGWRSIQLHDTGDTALLALLTSAPA
jgi:hypothetical protein